MPSELNVQLFVCPDVTIGRFSELHPERKKAPVSLLGTSGKSPTEFPYRAKLQQCLWQPKPQDYRLSNFLIVRVMSKFQFLTFVKLSMTHPLRFWLTREH